MIAVIAFVIAACSDEGTAPPQSGKDGAESSELDGAPTDAGIDVGGAASDVPSYGGGDVANTHIDARPDGSPGDVDPPPQSADIDAEVSDVVDGGSTLDVHSAMPDSYDSGMSDSVDDTNAKDIMPAPDAADSISASDGYDVDSGNESPDAALDTKGGPCSQCKLSPGDECAPDCVLGDNGCVTEDSGWLCDVVANPDGENCHVIQWVECEGVCSEDAESDGRVVSPCTCPPAEGTVCQGYAGPGGVVQATQCAGVGTGPLLEECELPGCWQGACQEENPHSEMVWPFPTSVWLFTVLPIEPGRALVAGYDGSLFEYDEGQWHDRRFWHQPGNVHTELLRGDDGVVTMISDSGQWTLVEDSTIPWTWSHDKDFFEDKPPSGKAEGSARSAWGVDQDNLVVAFSAGGALRTKKDGVWHFDWFPVTEKTLWEERRSVWGTSMDDVWVVGSAGLARRYGPQKGWELVPGLSVEMGGTTEDLTAVDGTAEGSVYVMRGPVLLARDGSKWVPIFTSPEPDAAHHLWVGGDDDIWVAGGTALSHYDGESWTTYETGIEGSRYFINDIECLDSNAEECWAVGDGGVVLRFDGYEWTLVSEGQDEIVIDASLGTTGVSAVSPDVVFTAVKASKCDDCTASSSFVRRHLLSETGDVTDVDVWETGPGYSLNTTVWAAAPNKAFVSTKVPKEFDGQGWSPIALPVPSDFICTTLTGRDGVVYLALLKAGSPALIADRPAAGGAWNVRELPYALEVDDLWAAEDGTLYALQWDFVYKLPPDGPPEIVASGSWSTEQVAVSSDGLIVLAAYTGGYKLITPEGAHVKFDAGWHFSMEELAPHPSGVGFISIEKHIVGEFGVEYPLPDSPGPTDFKPYAHVSNASSSGDITPWGDIYVGMGGGGLARTKASGMNNDP